MKFPIQYSTGQGGWKEPRRIFQVSKSGVTRGQAPGKYRGRGPAQPVPSLSHSALQALLVGLDHLLDHLAAHGTGLTGGQVAVVALLEVDANLP